MVDEEAADWKMLGGGGFREKKKPKGRAGLFACGQLSV